MTKLLTAAALTLATAIPASAQSFYPSIYATRYCELRNMGVDTSQARRVAMDEAWSSTRESIKVDYNGKQVSTDAIAAGRLVVSLCPEVSK
jgi:hypothetical protein